MRILMISSEASPLAKTGGLGDILGSLPEFLNQIGLDVRLMIPAYKSIDRSKLIHKSYHPSKIQLGNQYFEFSVEEAVIQGSNTPVYLIHCNELYDRPDLYGPKGGAYEDNDIRYAFQCKVSLEIKHLVDWAPQILHCHDWGAALVPLYQKMLADEDPQKHLPNLITIHSLEHQGHFPKKTLEKIGLPFHFFNPDRLVNRGELSFMEAGLWWTHKITTVSPTYAKEIQTPDHGFGLDKLVLFRDQDIVGILNGIRECEWDPSNDKRISANFNAEDLSGKAQCKLALQEEMGFESNLEIPLLGTVSRLFSQKGMDRFADEIPQLLEKTNFQFVLLGSGDPKQEAQYSKLQEMYPDKISISLEFNADLAHGIMAGSDLFMMPSRYEPCGLSQIYSMRYGSLPIVRSTGGLKDTVHGGDLNEHATGFHFENLSSETLQQITLEAIHIFKKKPDIFKKMQKRAMNLDFSWGRSAEKYKELYLNLLD